MVIGCLNRLHKNAFKHSVFCARTITAAVVVVNIINIIIIIITTITTSTTIFTHSIYIYILETNHVSTAYNVAAIVWSQPVVHILLFPMINVLYFYISTFQSMCAVPSIALLLFPDVMLSRYCSGIYQIILRWFKLPLITGTTFVSTFHMQCIFTVWSYISKSSQILS